MPFHSCSIVGLGLLGGSLALDLRCAFPNMVITGIARRSATLEEAARLTIDGTAVFSRLGTKLADARDSELVVLCTPVQTTMNQLVELGALLPPGAVVTDVGSTKRMIMNAAATALPPGVHFVGGHPLAGSDRAGLAHARAGLYRGATWALCVPAGSEEAAATWQAMLATLGARPLTIDPDLHDALVARTSHLPHVMAGALTNLVLAGPYGDQVLPFIAGGFRDSTRIAAANPAMWRDICLTNGDNLVAALDSLTRELTQWRNAIRAGDAPHLEALLTTAHDRRERLNTKEE